MTAARDPLRRIIGQVMRNAVGAIVAVAAILTTLVSTPLARADDDSYINAVGPSTGFSREQLLHHGENICSLLRSGRQSVQDMRGWVLYFLVDPAQHELCPDTLGTP
jgi:hypothetical protein